MIASLKGRVLACEDDCCIIDVHGVGYRVYASTRTLSSLPAVGEEVRLMTEMIVREDAILLYGFWEKNEQDWFRLLRVVQGVGTRMALAILSILPPGELAATLRAGDKKNLQRVPGVGARLAGRIATELQDRIKDIPVSDQETHSFGKVGDVDRRQEDALMFLQGLGFRRFEALPVIQRILKQETEISLDKLLKSALKALGQ